MKTNRKKTATHRFNGVWGTKPVMIAELESLIEQFTQKLGDPNDPDDKRWTKRWLVRFQKELVKKERAREHKITRQESDHVRASDQTSE